MPQVLKGQICFPHADSVIFGPGCMQELPAKRLARARGPAGGMRAQSDSSVYSHSGHVIRCMLSTPHSLRVPPLGDRDGAEG
jgi:hypothetical protein